MDSASQPGSSGVPGSEKPPPMDLSHHWSETTRNRHMGKMKEYYKFFQIPGIGNLAGGLPNVRFFPFDTLEAQTAKPERWTPSPDEPGTLDASSRPGLTGAPPSSSDPMAAAHITVPKEVDGEPNPAKKIDLATALQYGLGDGYPPLLSWIRQFTRENLHPDVPYAGGPEVVMTVGSTDGFAKTLELLVDPWMESRGDPVSARPGLLCETFMYANVLSQAEPKGVQAVPVAADGGGMCVSGPGGLEDVLGNWDDGKGKRPSIMYTVTMGHNPTGIVLSVQRRKEIYAACSKYDVIIVEDDPYWYLQFPSAAAEEAKSRGRPAPSLPEPEPSSPLPHERGRSSGYPFLDSLVPSFLSFDTDGRVIRLDTFSKTVAPGCRLGWITAQPAFVERLVRITEVSTQQPSGFVQSVIGELVMGPQPAAATAAFRSLSLSKKAATSGTSASSFAGWQTDGWVRWLAGLRGEYERRMQRMCRALDEGAHQLKQGTPLRPQDHEWGVITKTRLYDFLWPRGGMFVWIRVLFESHPLWGKPRTEPAVGVLDGPALSMAMMILLTTKPYLVLVAPGSMFSADDHIRDRAAWAYFRMCFAAEAEDKVEPLTERFVEGVHRFWRIKKVQEIEDLLGEFAATEGGAAGVAARAAASGGEDGLANLGVYLGC